MAFLANFTNLCNIAGKSPTAVCKELGLSNATYSYWKKTNSEPSERTLRKIAAYFGIEKSDLLDINLMNPEVYEWIQKRFEERPPHLDYNVSINSFKLSSTIDKEYKISTLIDADEEDLLYLYRRCSSETKAFVLNILEKDVSLQRVLNQAYEEVKPTLKSYRPRTGENLVQIEPGKVSIKKGDN